MTTAAEKSSGLAGVTPVGAVKPEVRFSRSPAWEQPGGTSFNQPTAMAFGILLPGSALKSAMRKAAPDRGSLGLNYERLIAASISRRQEDPACLGEIEQDLETPSDEKRVLEEIEDLLRAGNLQSAFSKAVCLPTSEIQDDRLRKLAELARPADVRPSPQKTAGSWTRDVEWLRRNASFYRGKWVAVHDGDLVASADTLVELKRALADVELKDGPLVHRFP